MIDAINEAMVGRTGEAAAQFALAKRNIQMGQMWAVKAETWTDEE